MPLHERGEQSESVHQRNAERTQLRREITHLTEKYDNVLEQLRDQHSYNWAIVRLFNELQGRPNLLYHFETYQTLCLPSL